MSELTDSVRAVLDDHLADSDCQAPTEELRAFVTKALNALDGMVEAAQELFKYERRERGWTDIPDGNLPGWFTEVNAHELSALAAAVEDSL